MPIFDGNLPYTNLHELNLDWIVKYVGEVKAKTDNIDNSVLEAKEYAENAQSSEENAENILEQILEQTSDLFVTPEMYDAVGDGVTDDTLAVQSALDSGKKVYLTKTYLITSPLLINNNVLMEGNKNTNTNTTAYNLKFANNVKACIIFSANNLQCSLHNVSLLGTNNENQGLFVSRFAKSYVKLDNCLVSSFDSVFVGGYSLSYCTNSLFYRIAKAFIFGAPATTVFSYSEHTNLLYNINQQLPVSLPFLGMGESVFSNCYVSGQGVAYPNVGIFVGGSPFDVKFIGCYVDYWSAYYIDVYTGTLTTEPITFDTCSLDSIITLVLSTQNSAQYIARGLSLINSIICRFNASFNSNVTVPVSHFMYKYTGIYPRFTDIKIINCHYVSTTTNASLSAYKFIYFDDHTVTLDGCIFDFDTKDPTTIDDIVSLNIYSITAKNRFPIIDFKVYTTMPAVKLINGNCDSYNGHVFEYNNDVYMNVNGIAKQIA